MLLVLQISILIVGVNAQDICKDLYQEFSLDNGYNKNLEPPANLVITDNQKIHDIEEVKHENITFFRSFLKQALHF